MEKIRSRKKGITFIVVLLIFIVWLIITNINIQTTLIKINNEDIPKSFDKYRIAVIADLHNKQWSNKLTKSLDKSKPDIIVIVGDLIDSSKTDIDVAMDFVDNAIKLAPVYYVSGNHEAWSGQYENLKSLLLKSGVIVLDDEEVLIKNKSDKILMLGLSDPDFYKVGAPHYESASLIESRLTTIINGYEGYKVLLSHRPEHFETYSRLGVDLTISGHAHGGQVRIPFLGGLIAPNQGFMPQYTSGRYTLNEKDMVVSRGLGNSIIPIRFNNMPQLVIIELDNDN